MQSITEYPTKSYLLAIAVILSAVALSSGMPEDEELSPEHKACLYECLTCEEMWGDNYDAHTCAETCDITEGASIDYDCRSGIRYQKRTMQSSNQLCQQLCVKCGASSPSYSTQACSKGCKEGSSPDYTCSKYTKRFMQKH